MTETLNWLILLAFAAASIPVARWVTQEAFKRWEKSKTGAAFAFLYVLILATIAGFSFVIASVIYYEILYQEAFMQLEGFSGAIKFLLMFTGLWYAAAYAFTLKSQEGGPSD